MGLILAKYLFSFLLFVSGIVLLIFAYRLATSNESNYRNNRLRQKKWFSPFKGEISTFYDGYRDDLVHAGLAVDTKTNEWREQGALSEEAVDSVIRVR